MYIICRHLGLQSERESAPGVGPTTLNEITREEADMSLLLHQKMISREACVAWATYPEIKQVMLGP